MTRILFVSAVVGLVACGGKADEKTKKAASKQVAKAAETKKPKVEEPPADEKDEAEVADEPYVEPTLNPKDPRETFEVFIKKGERPLDGIYREREAILTKIERSKGLDSADDKALARVVEEVLKFGIGEEPKELEDGPARLCKIIEEVRTPAEALINTGEAKLQEIRDAEEKLEAKATADAGVTQKQWDNVEADITKWSAPVTAGKMVMLLIRSLLDEGYLLADLGPRRSQLALKECLSKMEPLQLEQAQDRLDDVVKRAERYLP